MFQIQPVKFGREFALAATLYLIANALVMNYFHVAEHMRGTWMANVSNYLLTYTYTKAISNTILAKLHIKKKAGFKPTEKTAAGGGAAGTSGATAQIQAALMNRLTSLTRYGTTDIILIRHNPCSIMLLGANKRLALGKVDQRQQVTTSTVLTHSLCVGCGWLQALQPHHCSTALPGPSSQCRYAFQGWVECLTQH